MIIAGTGHRPDKLGGYSEAAYGKLYRFAEAKLLQYKPKEIISGMALGWDQALAHAAIILKIPFQAAIPFAGQEASWPEASRERYHKLLAHATVKVFVNDPGYAAWKMQKRNEWMVRHANVVLALWDGSEGGTANCVKYAEGKGATVWNVWPEWTQFPL